MKLFVVIVAFAGHALAAVLYARGSADASVRGFMYFASKVVVNAIPLLWVLRYERRRVQRLRVDGRSVRLGAASGVLMAAVIAATYFWLFRGRLATDGLRDTVAVFGVVDRFFWFAPFLCLVNSGLEEYYWRWFMYKVLRRWTGMWAAAVVSAVGFTLHHIVVLTAYFPDARWVVLMSAGVFAAGVVWAVLYEKCGRIIGPWVSHMIADAVIMVVAYDLLFNGFQKAGGAVF